MLPKKVPFNNVGVKMSGYSVISKTKYKKQLWLPFVRDNRKRQIADSCN